MPAQSTPSSKFQLLKPGLHAMRTYWPAILVIQICAAVFVFVYYKFPSSRSLFALLSDIEATGGLLFASLATVVSGGIIPEILKHYFRPKDQAGPKRIELIHQFAMWALLGIIVDLLYQFQTTLFGDTASPLVIFKKTLFDQLLFTPLVSLPFITSWFLLFEVNYALNLWIKKHTLPLICSRILPLWATSLSFWPIMLLIIYSLPSELQFPLFLFGNSAFSILMIFIVRSQRQT